jgi:hypothetical protein
MNLREKLLEYLEVKKQRDYYIQEEKDIKLIMATIALNFEKDKPGNCGPTKVKIIEDSVELFQSGEIEGEDNWISLDLAEASHLLEILKEMFDGEADES